MYHARVMAISSAAAKAMFCLRQAPRALGTASPGAVRDSWFSSYTGRLAELAAIAAEKDNVEGPSAAKEVRLWQRQHTRLRGKDGRGEEGMDERRKSTNF